MAEIVCSAETTRTPSGTISAACCAAEPCHTPSMRVALPPTAAASGTVASISSLPGASASFDDVDRLGLAAQRDAQHDRRRRRDRLGVLAPAELAVGHQRGAL